MSNLYVYLSTVQKKQFSNPVEIPQYSLHMIGAKDCYDRITKKEDAFANASDLLEKIGEYQLLIANNGEQGVVIRELPTNKLGVQTQVASKTDIPFSPNECIVAGSNRFFYTSNGLYRIDKNNESYVYPLPKEGGVLKGGRKKSNDIVIEADDPLASGDHFELFKKSGQIFFRDVGSSNGTWKSIDLSSPIKFQYKSNIWYRQVDYNWIQISEKEDDFVMQLHPRLYMKLSYKKI